MMKHSKILIINDRTRIDTVKTVLLMVSKYFFMKNLRKNSIITSAKNGSRIEWHNNYIQQSYFFQAAILFYENNF